MDSPQPAQATLETLRTVEFRLGLKGYNVDEVDEYLEKAAVEAEGLQEQVRQLTERLRQASERIGQLETERREVAEAPAPAAAVPEVATDDSLQRTLLLAQKFVDQAKRESEAEATEIVAQAEERARATLAQADDRARQMVTDAEHRLREEVTRLEAMRGQLANDVENMARHLETERNRLRSSLTEILKWVDEHIQPANALMGVRPRAGSSPSAPPEPARAGDSGPAPVAGRTISGANPVGGPGAPPPAGGEGSVPRPAEPAGAQVLDLHSLGGTLPGDHR